MLLVQLLQIRDGPSLEVNAERLVELDDAVLLLVLAVSLAYNENCACHKTSMNELDASNIRNYLSIGNGLIQENPKFL